MSLNSIFYHLLSQIQTRFSDSSLDILDALYMPKHVVATGNWKPKFSKFLEIYKDDLSEPRHLTIELEMWSEKCKMAERQSLPLSLTDVLLFAGKVYIPNIHTAFQIFAKVPVTTCTCERSISSVRRLKTYLHNSMSESRLKGLALLNIHRTIAVDINEVINRSASKHPRRMALADILTD